MPAPDVPSGADDPAATHPVLLSDVVSEMESIADEWNSFVNRETGEVVGLLSDAFRGAEDRAAGEEPAGYYGDADAEMIDLAMKIEFSDQSASYEQLPDKFEIHEWSIMRDFCDSVENDSHRSQLLDAIHGSGAFRHFKSTIARLEIRDDWFRYRDAVIEQKAIDWLDSHNIAWVRSRPPASQ